MLHVTSMAPITLYITYRSPYARKIRIALLEKGIPFEEVVVDLANRSEAFFKLNPAGTVPTLVTADGLVLVDSTLMLHYLESLPGVPSLLPKTERAKWEAWNWEELADRLCDQQVNIFFEAKKEVQRPDVFAKATRVTDHIITVLEAALENKDYIMTHFSLADIAMGPVLAWIQFRLSKDLSTSNPHIHAWLKRLNERESFQKTLPKL